MGRASLVLYSQGVTAPSDTAPGEHTIGKFLRSAQDDQRRWGSGRVSAQPCRIGYADRCRQVVATAKDLDCALLPIIPHENAEIAALIRRQRISDRGHLAR